MKLLNIPSKAVVFIDANIFVYYFAPDPKFGPDCKALMERINKLQDINAVTSTHVLSEVAHQLMILEAVQQFGWPLAGITQRLRRQPAEIGKLIRFWQAIEDVPRLGIQVLAVEPHLPQVAASLSQMHGMLTNDALILAHLQHESITHLASNDADFDRIPGLSRYAPA